MPSTRSRLGLLAAVVVGTLFVATTLVEVPRLHIGGTTVPTQSVLGVVAGAATLAVAASQFRGGDTRSALQFGLLGVGVPLALSDWRAVATLGVCLCLLSVPVASGTDRWLRERFTDSQ